jgi:hypothetical protein
VAKRDQQLPKAEDYALLHLGLLDGRDAGLDAGLKSFEATWRHTKANMERVADALDAGDLSKVIETDLPPHRWGVAAGSIAELFSDDPKVAADELRKAVKRIERSGGAEGDLSSRRLCRRRQCRCGADRRGCGARLHRRARASEDRGNPGRRRAARGRP